MTDKVQKIRDEVEKLKLCTMDEHMKFYSESAEAEYYALCKVEEIIDSLQEEPVKIDRRVSKMADEFAEREYETDGYERQWLSKGYYHGYMDANKGKLKEPVSNPIDFEKELYKAFGQVKDFTLGMRIAKHFYELGKKDREE